MCLIGRISFKVRFWLEDSWEFAKKEKRLDFYMVMLNKFLVAQFRITAILSLIYTLRMLHYISRRVLDIRNFALRFGICM